MLEIKMNITTFYLRLYYFIGIILVLVSDVLEEIPGIEIFESAFIILGSLFLLIKSINNIILTFIFGTLLFSNYSICFPNYIIFNSNTIFTSLSDTSVGYVGLQIILLFMSILGLFFCAKTYNRRIKNLFNFNVKQNVNFYFFHAGMLVVLLGILIFAYTRPEVSGERGSPSTIYEYSIILIIVGMYYSARNKLIQGQYIALVVLYAIQNFLFGGRITGLQLIFVLLIFFLCDKKISFKFVSFGVALYITMVTIGDLRGQILTSNVVIILNGVQNIAMKGFALDTAYSSYFTSLQFVLTADFTSMEQRFYMGGLQLISYIIGGTMLPEANIAKYVSQYFVNYMGGYYRSSAIFALAGLE